MTKIRKDNESLYAIVGGYIVRPYRWQDYMSMGYGNDTKVPIDTKFKDGQTVRGHHMGGSVKVSMKLGKKGEPDFIDEVWTIVEVSQQSVKKFEIEHNIYVKMSPVKEQKAKIKLIK